MFDNSINEALSNQKTNPENKVKKRELSEYNKFIKENSGKVSGTNRLKKLSKLWKQYKRAKK